MPDLICIIFINIYNLTGFIARSNRQIFDLLKLPNQISSPSSCILGTACLIICDIYLFVMAANREAILLVTYTSLLSLVQGTG